VWRNLCFVKRNKRALKVEGVLFLRYVSNRLASHAPSLDGKVVSPKLYKSLLILMLNVKRNEFDPVLTFNWGTR